MARRHQRGSQRTRSGAVAFAGALHVRLCRQVRPHALAPTRSSLTIDFDSSDDKLVLNAFPALHDIVTRTPTKGGKRRLDDDDEPAGSRDGGSQVAKLRRIMEEARRLV